MRLLRFYIGQYRVLRDLDLRFDPQALQSAEKDTNRRYYLDFLVGVNGTGKSTVLQLLGRIFHAVSQSYDALGNIPFILEYYLESKQQMVQIASVDPDAPERCEMRGAYWVRTARSLDQNWLSMDLKDAVDTDLLPERVIAHTTGNEAAWLAHTTPYPLEGSSSEAIRDLTPDQVAAGEMPGWEVPDLYNREENRGSPFRLVRQEEAPMVALAGLLRHSIWHSTCERSSPLTEVLNEIKIQELAGFSLQFDLSWASHGERNDIWERFGQYADRAIRNGGKVLLVFTSEKFSKVLEANTNALSLFEIMADWYRRDPPLLSGVNLFLKRNEGKDGSRERPPLHTWEWLSDGERSFLARMCLFMLFSESESLILLDEPEVHFNDFWKRQIVFTLDQILRESEHKNHVLIASHSSITLSDVNPNDILILERPGLFTEGAKMPTIQTFGAEPGDIMVHVFGAPNAAGEHSVRTVEEWLKEAYDKPPDERREYLRERLRHVSPGYWAYRIRRAMVEVSNDPRGPLA